MDILCNKLYYKSFIQNSLSPKALPAEQPYNGNYDVNFIVYLCNDCQNFCLYHIYNI